MNSERWAWAMALLGLGLQLGNVQSKKIGWCLIGASAIVGLSALIWPSSAKPPTAQQISTGSGDNVGRDKNVTYQGPSREELKQAFREVLAEDGEKLAKLFPEWRQVLAITPKEIVPAPPSPETEAPSATTVRGLETARVAGFNEEMVAVFFPRLEINTNVLSRFTAIVDISPLGVPRSIASVSGYSLEVVPLVVKRDLVIVGVGLRKQG